MKFKYGTRCLKCRTILKAPETLRLISTKEQGYVHQRRNSHRTNRMEEIFQLIKKNPGIMQCELHTHVKLHHSNISMYVLSLCAKNRIERIRVGCTYKLYIQGTIQDTSVKSRRHVGYWQEKSPMNKAHGEAFFKAFDKEFDLKPIFMARGGALTHG